MAEVKKTPAKADSSAKDAEKNRAFGILAYIGILFLVPLLAAPDSKFAKFHANQGLNLFIGECILGIAWWVLVWIPVIGWLAGFAAWVILVTLSIMGIINAANGKMQKLPLVGDIQLIK
jgi:uncharacterized membrane protein